ncbi:MAG: hypothetical protein WCY11_12930 [Novosphingobium sp.]
MALIRPSSYWRRINPVGAVADFREVYRQAGSNRWRFALAAGAVTIAIFSVMWQEEVRGPPPRPTVTIITSWPADRSDAEIAASNLANQRYKEKVAADAAAREQVRRDMYKSLGRMSGMDVDAIERKAMAERAAQEKADREEAARIQQQGEAALAAQAKTQAATAQPSAGPAGE